MAIYRDSIGTIGGFVLPDGSEISLEYDDIGMPQLCGSLGDLQETFQTTIEFDGIPVGTTYGWCPQDDCWYYIIDDGVYFSVRLLKDL
jgi:hypothetical protein